MGEVFSGSFELRDGLMHSHGEESVGAPGSLTVSDPRAWTGAGNGFERFEALARLADDLQSVHADTWPRASAVAGLAAHWLGSHEGLPATAAQPVYLRDKVAEKPQSSGTS